MSDRPGSRLTRRTVVVSLAGAAMAACSPAPQSPPTAAPAPTQPPAATKPAAPAATSVPAAAATAAPSQSGNPAPAATKPAAAGSTTVPQPAAAAKGGPAQIRVLTSEFFYDAMIVPPTEIFNTQNKERANVTVEKAPDGWITKVIQMVRDKNVLWSSYTVDSFFNLYQRVKTGMVQPLDPYINSSSVPGAKTFKDQYINKTVYDAGVMDGKFYHFPNKLNLTMVPYNVDYVKGAGFETIPATWDEMRPFLRKIKDKYGKDDVIPTAINMDLWRAVGGIFCTFTSKPYNADGMVDIDSPEWFQAIELMKSFYDDKLAEPSLLASPDEGTVWQKGKIAVVFNYPSAFHAANNAFPGKYNAANLPKVKATDPGRTWVHVDGTYLFANAPYPQETVDWMITMLGPEGPAADAYTKGILNRSGYPMYKQHVEGPIVKENKELPWLYDKYKMMEGATTAPLSAFHFLLDTKLKKYLVAYFKGELSAKDAMAKVKAEVDQDRDKMLSGNS